MLTLFKSLAVIGALVGALAASSAHAAEPTRFTVEIRGEGPDVVLIPGLASSRAVWADTAARLEGRYRVHLVQVSGFAGEAVGGNAEGPVVSPLADEIAAYIKAQGLDRPAVIGHSMGGLTALMIAQRHPGLADRIMIVDALPFFSVLMGPTMTVETVTPRAAGLRDMLIGQSPEAFAAGQAQSMAGLVKSPQGRTDSLAWSMATDRSVMARAMYDVMTTDLRPALASVQTPVTVVYARDDAMGMGAGFVQPLYEGNYAALPAKTLIRVDGALHFVMLDQPDVFAAAVEQFLK
ncbi:MAG: alpha/beta hydrolase [Caulobacter sp.]|nr:alpha/beta hydrolase [Caulobacter sp.]